MNWDQWERHAAWLAGQVTEPGSRWRPLVAAAPRHQFVPRWWAGGDGWQLRDGPAMPIEDWLCGVYRDTSLVTQVGTLHADHATLEDRPEGRPTSSSSMPGLVVAMYRHAMISDGMDVLDVGTGSRYGTALLAARLGRHHPPRERTLASYHPRQLLARPTKQQPKQNQEAAMKPARSAGWSHHYTPGSPSRKSRNGAPPGRRGGGSQVLGWLSCEKFEVRERGGKAGLKVASIYESRCGR